MRGKKNDFSMSFFRGGLRVLHLHYVHDTDKALAWVVGRNIAFDDYVVFDRRKGIVLYRHSNLSLKKENSAYSLSFFYGGRRVLFLEYVQEVDYAISWANRQGISFEIVKVYDRHSRLLLDELHF